MKSSMATRAIIWPCSAATHLNDSAHSIRALIVRVCRSASEYAFARRNARALHS